MFQRFVKRLITFTLSFQHFLMLNLGLTNATKDLVQQHLPKRRGFPAKRDKLCSKDSFVVNGSLVFQIKFCGKNPALPKPLSRQFFTQI
jgi:hypothetical protein